MVADPAVPGRRDLDWFATPPDVADMAAASAFLAPGVTVLEPSAGEGALVRAAARAGCVVDAVEAAPARAAVLRETGLCRQVIEADFLTLDPPGTLTGRLDPGGYNRILMNPPFGIGHHHADVEHVTWALQFLKPGGYLVAIMGIGIRQRSDKATAALRELILGRANLTGDIEDLPNGCFRASGARFAMALITLPGPGWPWEDGR